MVCDGKGNHAVAQNNNLSENDVENFFRQHTVEGNHAVAMKKRSLGTVTYFATVHGYPNNLAVCEEVLAPYNTDVSRSAISGEYFCEVLH
jgi:hypothetical protein